jgi:dipeptidyl aminopeptidase/acylaminoacyl peptidase
VLQVNFRGSTGFGKNFLNAGNGEWGQGSMQHDLTDAVKWAINQGIADPKRVAIMGGSYGGYATLAGLTFTPELYACGVDIVGMSNMQTTFAAIPPYWAPFKRLMLMRVGDVEADEEYNRRISPLFHADKIRVPLLIGQGANDPRVNIEESNQIVAAMRKNERPVTYVVYPDEGHGFRRPPNLLDFRGRAERFLAGCLGGRAEAETEVEGTTAQLH